MKWKSISVGFGVIIFLILGILLILLLDWLLFIDFFKEWNLSNLNYLISSLGFVLSIITIFLLYKNYRHQEREFAQMNRLNNDANQQLVRSNELIIINNQIEYLTKIFNRTNFNYNASYKEFKNLSFNGFITVCYKDLSDITNLQEMVNSKYESIDYNLNLILDVISVLQGLNIKNFEPFIRLRLPRYLFLFTQEYREKYGTQFERKEKLNNIICKIEYIENLIH